MLQAVIEPVSNREDWIDQCEVRDENNALVNLTGAVIVIAVRDPTTKSNVLKADTASGSITLPALGIFQFTFPLAQMHGLVASRSYEVGCTIKLGSITRQFFIGSVNVLDGVVP